MYVFECRELYGLQAFQTDHTDDTSIHNSALQAFQTDHTHDKCYPKYFASFRSQVH